MANGKRLIDANAFEANIQKMFIPYGDGTYPGDYQAMIHDETLADVLETIEEAPTVDAVEVVHGRWLKAQVEAGDPYDGNSFYIFDVFQCSECGAHFDVSEALNYCPNCGAKMDGDEDG